MWCRTRQHGGVVLCMLVCGAILATLASGGCAHELRALPAVYPDAGGVTKVNLSVVAREVRVPLATHTRRGKQRYFVYTARLYALDTVDNSVTAWHDVGNVSGGRPLSRDLDTAILPGPCIHVVPGGKLVLQVTNGLGAEQIVTRDNLTSTPPQRHRMHTFHSPNTTNVHFHGMHSDPNIDDPFVSIAPGTSHVYKLRVPRSHIPGYHWYHAHYHGSVYYQVMGGLFGPMMVDDGRLMTSPAHPFRAWPRHVLLMHLYRLTKSSVCDGATLREVDDAMATNAPTRARVVDDDDAEYTLPSDLFLVNGQHRPTVPLMRSVPTVLHLGYAAGSCYVNVSLPRSCAFHVAAYDGVPLQRTQAVSQHWLYFTTATRIDVVALCNTVGVFPVRLRVHNTDKKPDDDDAHDVIFYLDVRKGTGKAQRQVRFPVTLPRYNADYLDLSGQQTAWHDISLSQLDLAAQKPRPYYVLGQGSNCSSLRNSSTCAYTHFMGSLSDNASGARGFAVPLYTVLTAHLYGDPTDAVPHPFHFHVNHFRVVSFTPRAGGQHANHTLAMYGIRRGQFRDTIPVLDGVTTVQWQAASYTGEVVYHCHNLVHEDHGMMLSYMVYADPLNTLPQAARDARREKANTSSVALRGAERHDGRAYYLVLALVFFVASGVALGWQWMRHHSHHLEAIAQTRSLLAGQPVAVNANEAAPLLPQP